MYDPVLPSLSGARSHDCNPTLALRGILSWCFRREGALHRASGGSAIECVGESAYSAVVALIAYIYASLMPVGTEKARWRPDLPSVKLVFR